MPRWRRPHATTRLRLTAWYAALLVLVLLTLGISVDTLARNRLQDDVDRRIEGTAEDIGAVIEKNLANWPFSTQPVRFEDIVPTLGSFASRGLLIQIADPTGVIVRGSEYAPRAPLMGEDPQPSGEPRFTTTDWGGDDLRAVHFPITVTDSDGVRWYIGAVIVGERLTTMHETLDSLRQVLLVTSTAGLLLALAGGWVLAGRALRPVDGVTAAAARIAAGDGTATSLSARLPVPPTNDELSRLSSTFNAMLDRLQASFRGQERFVADASHELRTPLTAIRGNVDVLLRQARLRDHESGAADVSAALLDIRRESDRMRRLLDDLLLLARSDASATPAGYTIARDRWVRLDELAREAVRSAEALGGAQVLEIEAPRSIAVPGDADRLHQLLMILLDNAIRHTPADGRIRVAVAATPDGTARIAVRDEGEGIASEHVPHIFERFYRADGARGRSSGGTGLGLAIARAICQGHGGTISVASAPGRGSTFVIELPGAAVSGPRELPSDPDAEIPHASASREPDAAYSTRKAMTETTSTAPTMTKGTMSPATDSLRKPRP